MMLRTRMMLAALIPVALVALVLTSVFLFRHLADLDHALDQRGRALAQQAAVTAEFSLFSGNREFLQTIAQGVLRTDDDVSGVAVVDTLGQIIAEAGSLTPSEWPGFDGLEMRRTGSRGPIFVIPVEQRTLAVDDAYSGVDFAVAARPRGTLGYVVLQLSRQRVDHDRLQLILVALFTALTGAVLGGVIALRIAHSVTDPVLEATDVVTRIGRGDLAARVADQAGPMQSLAVGINAMAERVGMTHEELRKQVDAATEELIQQRDTAERATAAKTRFLAAASHDLRQPLHALGLFVSRLSRMPWQEEQRRLIDHVEESVGTLQEMLDTLLDMSRLEAGGYRVTEQDFALEPLLQRVCRELAPLAYEKHLTLRLRALPVSIRSDPRLVERVVINLLTNALRYTERGQVLVACRRVAGRIRIQFWDTGLGIPAALQAEIFDEYVQRGNDERDRAKGLGLGLSICQRIAKLLATDIGLRSVPDRGSVFWIDLPLGEPVVPQDIQRESVELQFTGQVLVVDDDDLCRKGTAEVISGWGGQVRVARDDQEALACCEQAPSAMQLAVCDIRIAGDLDGISLGKRMQQLCPDLQVVLVSANVTPMVQALARRAGFPLLKKPVAPARLRATLLSLLDTKS